MSQRRAWGPRPATAGVQSISAARAAVLKHLRVQGGPLSVETLAEQTGQHRNTIREHLEALVTSGLARRMTAASSGRGRPAWLYQATEANEAEHPYATLALILAAHIARTSADPRAEGVRAGELWAQQVEPVDGVASAPPEPDLSLSQRRRSVEMLESVGFGVQSNESWTDIQLSVCPLLEAARQNPEVVCAVHLGLVRGSLKSVGADPDQATLVPFARPGACGLRLGERQRAAQLPTAEAD